MFYRKVYPAAWRLIKDNHISLIFGLFASILGFQEVKIMLMMSETNPDFLGSLFNFWVQLSTSLAVADITLKTLPSLLGLIMIFALLAAVVILAISSQAALVKSAAEKNGKLKNKFSYYLGQGVANFWPLFGLQMINLIISYFFVTAVVNPLIEIIASSNSYWTYFLLSLVVFFVFFPTIVVVSFVTRYGMSYIMIKDQKLWPAFVNSWELFRINWLLTIENAIFISAITVLYLIAMATAMIFVFVPFVFLSIFVGTLNAALFTLFITLGSLSAILIFLLASALYGAFYNVLWAKVFIEITTGSRSYSKIYRLGEKHFSRNSR